MHRVAVADTWEMQDCKLQSTLLIQRGLTTASLIVIVSHAGLE